MQDQPARLFRWIGYGEGLSFLLLLGVAMPLKYIWDQPLAVRYVGWAHGLLFVAYLIAAGRCMEEYDWSAKEFGKAVMAALLPFGPFVVERYLRFTKEASS